MAGRIVGTIPTEQLAERGIKLVNLKPGARWAVYYTADAMDQIGQGEQVNPRVHNALIRGVMPERAEARFLCEVEGPHLGQVLYLGGWLDPERGVVIGVEPKDVAQPQETSAVIESLRVM